MSKYILFIPLFLSLYSLTAQDNGFIQVYDLDSRPLTFQNLLVINDTLIVSGSTQSETTNQLGLFFAKIDTLGNIINYTSHFDDTGVSYVFEQETQMIATQDNGFLVQGSFFHGFRPLLIKLDSIGNKEWSRVYVDTTVLASLYHSIIETPHGYLSSGSKQQMDDYKLDGFIMYTLSTRQN